ncbi:MAG TPA: permease [Candidatus Methylomirabilis sp.]|nr:permease [Candidatus Methylomirabilis sp.]
MNWGAYLIQLLQSGLGSLASYLAAHVLLCLLPAFFIAGGLSALVPKDSVTRLLGRKASKAVAYPSAVMAGSVLAVCSCTIVPLFAGIYSKGAGLGPAITFLFFAPAGNVLALAYTGVALGADFALARVVLSLTFGIGIGMIMALIFSRDDQAHAESADTGFVGSEGLTARTIIFLVLMVGLLIFGTLQVRLLLNTYASFTLPIQGLDRVQDLLVRLVPFDATKGEEGVSVQGAILIGLLVLIGLSAWKGLGQVHEGYNRWTWLSLGLIGVTLFVAAMRMEPKSHGLEIALPGKLFGVVLTMLVLAYMARTCFESYEIQQWLWETWRFVRQIFPLLVVGVFAVGIIRQLIRPEWVQAVAGANTLFGNLTGVVFGVFMYFPTLVEVPIAKMFLSLGMHPGPLIAYLMADPELSLQSILITASIIGRTKAWTYVGWVALFSTISGLLYGAWVDGVSVRIIGGVLVGFIAVLAVSLWGISRRQCVATSPHPSF